MSESTQNWVTFTDPSDGEKTLIDLNIITIFLIVRSKELKKTIIKFVHNLSKEEGTIIVHETAEEILEILQPKVH